MRIKAIRSIILDIPKFTIHDIPFLVPFLGLFFRLAARLAGWKIIGDVPNYPKIVLIGAPHTSNWDYLLFLYGITAKRLRINVLIKNTLFWPPLGTILRFLGGIPINRTKSYNVIKQGIEFINAVDETIILIMPEGTRSYTEKWKSGFYHIAYGAKVPLILAKVDAKNKAILVGEEFPISGDYEKDIIQIQARFAPYMPKSPTK